MPLAIDLYCGLGGWTEGLLAEGYDVIGFDIERHRYPARAVTEGDGTKVRLSGVDFNSDSTDSRHRSFNYANQCAHRDSPLTGGWTEYPAQLVLQDVLTLHGRQFKDVDLIVASPPCQEYSYMAMPWSRAKAIAADYRSGVRDVKKLTALFDACFRIQREAIEAAGHFIPLVVENVRGAIPWVGRSRWNFGSFHLWGDVPALMPMVRRSAKAAGHSMNKGDPKWNMHHKECVESAIKNSGGSWFNIGSPGQKETNRNPVHEGVKHHGSGPIWFDTGPASMSSKSSARKAASAQIAKIPFALSQHIARSWMP